MFTLRRIRPLLLRAFALFGLQHEFRMHMSITYLAST